MMTLIKISGKPIADPQDARGLWCDLASFAGRVAVVHGGGVQVDELFSRLGVPVTRRDGIRLTPEPDMPTVAGVLAGTVNQTLVGLLCAAGARAVGLSLASSGVVEAEVDPAVGGRVGRVIGGDGSTVRALLGAGLLPVIASIGADSAGGLLNINADNAAVGVASAIGAERLVYLTDTDGVMDAGGKTIAQLDASEVEDLIAKGVISGGMAAKVRSIAEDARRFPGGVRIGHWRQAAGVVAGNAGCGTSFGAPAGLGESR